MASCPGTHTRGSRRSDFVFTYWQSLKSSMHTIWSSAWKNRRRTVLNFTSMKQERPWWTCVKLLWCKLCMESFFKEHSEIGLSQGIGVLVCTHIVFWRCLWKGKAFWNLGQAGLRDSSGGLGGEAICPQTDTLPWGQLLNYSLLLFSIQPCTQRFCHFSHSLFFNSIFDPFLPQVLFSDCISLLNSVHADSVLC